ncbi:MAG TPA: alpha/beta hydrolase [Chitinophagales bacterium]|nr:alpha/beta hydrolase [Chitinophagales bacterium]
METKFTSASPKIAFSDSGASDIALLMMPGWCANRTAFEPVTPLLSKHYRVLSMDWRSHGGSEIFDGDFGSDQLLEDALAVISNSGASKIIPVATAHAGWIAIKLREKLKKAVSKIILIDWMVFDAPPPFLEGLKAMQQPNMVEIIREMIFETWLKGVDDKRIIGFVRGEMASYNREMWMRAAREILNAFAENGTPLKAISGFSEKPEVLHIYGQPPDPDYLEAQINFSKLNTWFSVYKLNTQSHFPTLENPEEVSQQILHFLKN